MIHRSAYVEDAEIGEGTNIWHFVHIRKGARIGKKCNIGKGVYIDTNVKIGDECKIQNFATIYKGVEIENHVFIGPHVCFTNDLYPRAFIWNDERLEKTFVRKGASIGANSTIIAGVTIGEYAMVGAGSVVTRDVPDYGLALGNPARLKGFVCKCGFKLKEIIKEDKKVVVFKCSKCGEEIEIDKTIYREVKE
ncbi:MAG TPA: N-acetyltransferase [Thermoplasmatales archaeon]|nr:N-acetyltransferase [Thermoplasmatales archaeon]